VPAEAADAGFGGRGLIGSLRGRVLPCAHSARL